MDKDTKVKVSFHKHEIIGANLTRDFMKRVGFTSSETNRVAKLVSMHQFRFYEDTTDKAICRWLQKLGKQGFADIIRVRLADRQGNDKNLHKPPITKELQSLLERCDALIKQKKVVFLENLQLKKSDLNKLGVPKERQGECISAMLAIVAKSPRKNQKKILIKYVEKNYIPRGLDGESRDFSLDS